MRWRMGMVDLLTTRARKSALRVGRSGLRCIEIVAGRAKVPDVARPRDEGAELPRKKRSGVRDVVVSRSRSTLRAD